jgi:hypothetical protein
LVTTALSKRLARDSISWRFVLASFRKLPLTRESSPTRWPERARVWTVQQHEGSQERGLIIMTTMDLDSANKRYNKKFVEKLSRAARECLALSSVASARIIMNPAWVTTADAIRPKQLSPTRSEPVTPLAS